MKLRLRHTLPVMIVAVSLGSGSTMLLAGTGNDEKDAEPARVAVSDCNPAPARCGSEENDLVIAAANEAARRMQELQTTDITGASPISTVAPASSSAALVPEAWGALIDYESLAAVAR